MTDCNGCGGCCDPVVLPITQIEMRQILPAEVDPATRRWVLEDLTMVGKRAVLDKVAYQQIAGRSAAYGLDPRTGEKRHGVSYYECRWFDRDTRQCTNHDNRPPPCSEYPWGDGPPVANVALPFECSFRADIGQPVTIREKP